jgi:hypothetical protein
VFHRVGDAPVIEPSGFRDQIELVAIANSIDAARAAIVIIISAMV